MEKLFDKDGEIFKSVPAGGHGGGVTSFATVKATAEEAAACRAAQAEAEKPAGEAEGTAELKQDGPTIQDWVAAGYKARAYPPSGYASKSSAEDIAAAVAAEADKAKASS